MTPERPLFSDDADERALFSFYDAVPAAELFDQSECTNELSFDDFIEPTVTWEQALAIVQNRLGATLVEGE
jgi:hypothetical protein